MANDIVWYDSSETGAPVWDNSAGSAISVLDACLRTGFRALTLDSLTVTSNVATATYSSGHGYTTRRMVDIAGASSGGLNGRKLITVTGASTFTYPAPGVADGTYSGTAKRSPLGWAKPVHTGNVAIFTRTDVAATAMALRVDDSTAGSTTIRVRMVEGYTDINTFTGPAPTDAQLSGGGHWAKGANTSTPKRWVLVGDSRMFYLFTDSHGSANFGNGGGLMSGGFGDPVSYRASDAYGCCLMSLASAGTITGIFTSSVLAGDSSFSKAGLVWSRPASQVGTSTKCNFVSATPATTPMGGAGGTAPLYGSNVDGGGAVQYPMWLLEENGTFGNPIRGHAAGLAVPLCRGMGALGITVLDDLLGSDREWLVVPLSDSGGGSATNTGAILVDVTGPWR